MTNSKSKFLKKFFEDRDLLFLRVISLILIFLEGMYIYRYNFTYNVKNIFYYNLLLIPAYVSLIILSPILFFKVNLFGYRFFVKYLSFQGALLTTMLIYLAGGVMAPGVFWLTAIPLALMIMMGRGGLVFGSILVVVILFLFNLSDYFDMAPEQIIFESYKFERTLNLYFYVLFMIVTAYLFLRTQEQSRLLLEQRKSDTDSLLKILVHDVASPITTMSLHLEKIKKLNEIPEKSAGSVQKISELAAEIRFILEKVRTMSAVEDGKIDIRSNLIEIDSILNTLVDQFQVRAERKKVSFFLDSPEGIIARGDEVVLKNVILSNILSNALKFSEPQGRIDIRVGVFSKSVLIEVQDYGRGIPPEILKTIFDQHAQTTRVGTDGEQGTGFGMPLVKDYIEKMGGSVSIRTSEVSEGVIRKGTTVSIQLPIGN